MPEPEGGSALFTDADDPFGPERGAYKVDSVVVGFNRRVNGEFDSFVPRPVTIRATARDMTGGIHTGQITIDIAALADESEPDGALPSVLSPDPIELTDYPVVKDGKILLHESLALPTCLPFAGCSRPGDHVLPRRPRAWPAAARRQPQPARGGAPDALRC